MTLNGYQYMVTNLKLILIIKQNSYLKFINYKKSCFYYRKNAQNEFE